MATATQSSAAGLSDASLTLPSTSDITNASTLNTSLDSSENSLDSLINDLGISGLGSTDAGTSAAGSVASSSDTSFLSDLSSLGTDLTSALSSPLGELATYGGLTAYGLSQASAAQAQTQQEAGQITAASQPYLTAGQTLLSQYQSGTLPSWAQSTVNFDTTEGQSIINSGQGLQTIANQNLAQYSSGQLKPADQLALDQQTAAQTQQVMSQLGAGGTVDSSVAAAYTQQIQQNAAITQQNILNSYFTTGNTAYNSWLTSTAEGASLINQGGQFAQTTFNQMLTGALGLSDIGMQGLTTAIGLEIQSDTALSQEVSTLMSNIASAYAYTLAGPGRSGTSATGSTAGAVGGVSSLLGSAGNILSDLLGTSVSSAAASDSAAAAADVVGSSVPSLGNVGDSALSSLLSSEGFSTAGGAAAGTGLSALGASGISSLGSELGGASAAATASELNPALQSIGTDAATQAANAGDASAASAIGDSSSTLGGITQDLGAVGAGVSLYNEVESYESGATGSDALSGAETGASIGTYFVPGLGTAIGAALGAVGGAIASAFGGGKTDPETLNWDKVSSQINSNPQVATTLTAAQSYQLLAGVMDAKDNAPGHSQPIEQVFGREGEGAFMNQMTAQINQAVTSGKVSPNATAAQLYSQVVTPWLASKNASIANQNTSTGTPEGPALQAVITQLINLWQGGQITSSSQVGVSGQTIAGLPAYAGVSTASPEAASTAAASGVSSPVVPKSIQL
jgi:hypothetical protein